MATFYAMVVSSGYNTRRKYVGSAFGEPIFTNHKDGIVWLHTIHAKNEMAAKKVVASFHENTYKAHLLFLSTHSMQGNMECDSAWYFEVNQGWHDDCYPDKDASEINHDAAMTATTRAIVKRDFSHSVVRVTREIEYIVGSFCATGISPFDADNYGEMLTLCQSRIAAPVQAAA